MATGKKYYWIKLKNSFMTSDTVDFLMSQDGGANYVVLYQMLCLKTVNTDGQLYRQIGEMIIPFDIDKIERDCKWFSQDTIRVALELFKALGLIYEDNNGMLQIAEYSSLVGSETDYALQKRTQRCGQLVDSGVDNVHTEIDIRDRDKDKDINKPKKAYSRFVKPTIEEIQAYMDERNDGLDAQKFYDYYEARGWELRKGFKMKDFKAVIRTWESNNYGNKTKPTKDYGIDF